MKNIEYLSLVLSIFISPAFACDPTEREEAQPSRHPNTTFVELHEELQADVKREMAERCKAHTNSGAPIFSLIEQAAELATKRDKELCEIIKPRIEAQLPAKPNVYMRPVFTEDAAALDELMKLTNTPEVHLFSSR